jgi:toxin-antitoxin system PIN domain toxin
MIVLDANILLYAYDSSSSRHIEARHWVESTFSEAPSVGIPWQTIGAFLRVTTNPKLPGKRFSITDAAQVIDDWLAQPNVRALSPGENYWAIFRRTAITGQVNGPLITDAQLAAVTLEYGGVLHTTDRDFGRFPDLRWVNPLE